MRFFFCQNNNVVAVVSEEHLKIFANASEADAIKAGARVFTFCRPARLQEDPAAKLFFTGTFDDLKTLIKSGKHDLVEHTGGGWSGFVPFSNHEFFEGPHLHGTCLNEKALQYVCTLADIRAAFGLPGTVEA